MLNIIINFFLLLQVLSALDILQPPHLDFFQEMYPFYYVIIDHWQAMPFIGNPEKFVIFSVITITLCARARDEVMDNSMTLNCSSIGPCIPIELIRISHPVYNNVTYLAIINQYFLSLLCFSQVFSNSGFIRPRLGGCLTQPHTFIFTIWMKYVIYNL